MTPDEIRAMIANLRIRAIDVPGYAMILRNFCDVCEETLRLQDDVERWKKLAHDAAHALNQVEDALRPMGPVLPEVVRKLLDI